MSKWKKKVTLVEVAIAITLTTVFIASVAWLVLKKNHAPQKLTPPNIIIKAK